MFQGANNLSNSRKLPIRFDNGWAFSLDVTDLGKGTE
jgi:hypothetical protein